jgi:(1->4)-alpha-D-glucan 1-alpha-D-glucosylmutase
VFTSWLNPSEPHEEAMTKFVDAVLDPGNTAFRNDFLVFERRVAEYGIYNSLAQLAVKIGAPGVPDFYQGTEIWDFSLVDPDNRRPVDYARRQALLQEIDNQLDDRPALVSRLIGAIQDDRTKLYATTTMLRFRQEQRALFEAGSYEPLAGEGAHAGHVWGFARRHEAGEALVIVPRLAATLMGDAGGPPVGEQAWGDTRVLLPAGEKGVRPHYRNVFTGRCIEVQREDGRAYLRAADVFAQFPVALLT